MSCERSSSGSGSGSGAAGAGAGAGGGAAPPPISSPIWSGDMTLMPSAKLSTSCICGSPNIEPIRLGFACSIWSFCMNAGSLRYLDSFGWPASFGMRSGPSSPPSGLLAALAFAAFSTSASPLSSPASSGALASPARYAASASSYRRSLWSAAPWRT